MIKLTECPRDAMQGLTHLVPTAIKIEYINLLLQVGFDTIDFGSFVSQQAIPQMRDTAAVLEKLNLSASSAKLLVIVANLRGITQAIQYASIHYLGYPFSISETFQQRNTHASIQDSLLTVEQMMNLCEQNHKNVRVYLSMGFGNPYGDVWNHEIVEQWVFKLQALGVQNISLADTVGVSTPEKINYIYPYLAQKFPQIAFGIHLHSRPNAWREKIEAAYQSGCVQFDGALRGYGGCPMADDALVGNIATENIINYLSDQGEDLKLNMDKWQEAMLFSSTVFS